MDIPYSRELPHPIDAAYAWLTDYEDADAQRAGAVVHERRVVKRDDDVVVLEGHNVVLGRHARGKAEVRLFPSERRWQATIVEGNGRGSVYEYQLTPTDRGCRLDVRYRVRARRWRARVLVRLTRPFVRREIARMWDGFAAAMARELPA